MTFDTVEVAFPLADEFLDLDAGQHDERRQRFHLRSAIDLRAMPDMVWAMRSVFPAVGIATIYGPSGSGKSFIALEAVWCLAEARSFFGHGVARQHRVVVLVLEGEAGFRRRVLAMEKAYGRPFPKEVRFVFDAFNLLEGGDLADLATAINLNGGADVLVIDTLNRAMPGADENSARDASTLVANLGWLQRALGGLVIAIHHSGKDETRGMRGHSSLNAAMDAVISVTRTPGIREWSIAKSKDDTDGTTHPFTLEVVELGRDFMDDPITSCVVRSIDTPVDRTPRPPTAKNQRIIYEALGPLFRASTTLGKASAPPGRPCLILEDVIEQVKDRVPAEPRRQANRVREAVTGMVSTGILGFDEGWIWLK